MVKDGRKVSIDDAKRPSPQLPDEQEVRLKELQAALAAGERSGTPISFDNEAFLRRMRARRA